MKYQLRLYLELIRFDKPIGRILLAWPCLWGIAYAYHAGHAQLSACINYGLLLTVGAFLMSGFGCIINDIADRNVDRLVERTQSRPLAAQTLNIRQALLCAGTLASLAFSIFWYIPTTAKHYALAGAVLLFVYPFMKRVTYYPQVVLGLAFNSGVLVGYACLAGEPPLGVWYMYGCGVFWTIAYDTIYAFQDVEDDAKVGVKSTALRFNNCPKLMVGTCYLIGFVFLCLSKSGFGLAAISYACFALYVLAKWNPLDRAACARYFKVHALFSLFGLV